MSFLSMNLQADPGYNLEKVIKFPTIPWYTKLMLRLMLPISVIRLALLLISLKVAKNAMRDPSKEKFTGNKFCKYSEKISFDAVKKTSRTLKCTINDIMTCALSKAVSDFLKKRDDQSK